MTSGFVRDFCLFLQMMPLVAKLLDYESLACVFDGLAPHTSTEQSLSDAVKLLATWVKLHKVHF